MRFLNVIRAFVVVLAMCGTAAIGQDLNSVAGAWVCTTNCGCPSPGPGMLASIKSEGIARNECGAETTLSFGLGTVLANEWGVEGTIALDSSQIDWANGSVWKRHLGASEVETRLAYWESRTFYCADQGQFFPSKEEKDPTCDDGDSVMFNALLCRMGDGRGCATVQLSQDSDGRFWRSPAKALSRPEEPKDPLKGGQTTFSGDHAAGLFLYFSHTNDTDRFARWVAWIDANERCLTWCGGLPPALTPRYCKNDRCAMRLGDCQIMLLLGARMGVGVPFCSVSPFTPVPTVTSAAQTLQNAFDEIHRGMGFKPPGFELVEKLFTESMKVYQRAVAPVEALRTKLEARVVEKLLLAQLEKTLSVSVNDRGYSRHNAIVQVMMLEDMGLGRTWMNDSVRSVAREEPANPFFQFVAFRREGKESMLPLILKECPEEATDPHNPRRQWSWERDSAKEEWRETMYWDCLFIGRAYLDPSVPPSIDESFEEDVARKTLENAIEDLGRLQKLVEIALDHVRKVADLASNPAATIEDAIKDPVGTATQHLQDVKTTAEELGGLAVDSIDSGVETLGEIGESAIAEVDQTLPALTLPTKPEDIIPATPDEALPQVTVKDDKIEVQPVPGVKIEIPIKIPGL